MIELFWVMDGLSVPSWLLMILEAIVELAAQCEEPVVEPNARRGTTMRSPNTIQTEIDRRSGLATVRILTETHQHLPLFLKEPGQLTSAPVLVKQFF